jgi:pimeloyl-ACP methyl ester carboxylesterase
VTRTAPLVIADQGHFWVGVRRRVTGYGTVPTDHMFVQYQIPVRRRHPFPIVMVHGGGGQGLDFLATPDGRPGWATFFLHQGFGVYVVDRPGHGRARNGAAWVATTELPTYETSADVIFGNGEPTAQAPHTQWPGPHTVTSDLADQFCAGQGPFALDAAEAERAMQSAGAELLDRIGPAILLTHSLGGPFGWLVADARPGIVKAIVAIEPAGPPFGEIGPGLGTLRWGVTAGPLHYDPPARAPTDFRREIRPAPRDGLTGCFVQANPPLQLPNLRRLPVLVVTADASPSSRIDHGTVDFLRQAGVAAEHLRLEEIGIRGNGHLMMLERNSDEIAGRLIDWLTRTLPPSDRSSSLE